ncbi:hypothetical protein [Pseudomonas sp.]|uniref:hypothetical protein n=1 Tax=Pseudomonas sp. TaxID=306 RepID=UPI002587FED0|nr:hypothetical protein [Pseudomonas sp.]
MNDKQQLAAMGEHLAEQQPMCMAKRIEELEAQVLVMADLLRDLHGYIGASIPQTISEHYRGCDLLERIDSALASKMPSNTEQPLAMVPEGWQLVPVVPTESMIGHGCGASVMVVSEVIKAWAAMLAASPKPECWCHTCRPVTSDDMRMVLCPDCGNKRCPRANDHRNACTCSNEPGQEGSAYPAAPKPEPSK